VRQRPHGTTPAGSPSPLAPAQPLADVLPPEPAIEAGAPGTAGASPVPGAMPWERRQPQVQRRSVLPVEWFRRMPGGGTTYAPHEATPSDADDGTPAGRS